MIKAFLLVAISMIIFISICLIYDNVYAQNIDVPETFKINNISAYQGIYENNDQMFLIEYETTYNTGSPNTYTSETALICRLLHNGSEITSSSPFAYYNAGWCHGIVSIYLSANDVIEYGMTFSNHSIIFQGIPLLAWNGNIPTINTSNINYFSEDVQTSFESRIKVLAHLIENSWGIDLIQGNSDNSYFTAIGEEYFSSSISYLKDIVPDLYQATTITPSKFTREYYMDYYFGGANSSKPICFEGHSLNINNSGTGAWLQQFIARESYEVDVMQLMLIRYGTPNYPLEYRIGTDFDNYVSGTISSELINTDEPKWYNLFLNDTIELEKGTTYFVYISGSGTYYNNENNVYCSIYYDTSGELANDMLFYNMDFIVIENGNIVFAVISKDGFDMSFLYRMEHRLDDTIFDCTRVAELLGMTKLWFSSILWIVLEFILAYFVVKSDRDSNIVIWIFLLMTPVGALIGFVGWIFATAITGICCLIATYKLFWEPSTA